MTPQGKALFTWLGMSGERERIDNADTTLPGSVLTSFAPTASAPATSSGAPSTAHHVPCC